MITSNFIIIFITDRIYSLNERDNCPEPQLRKQFFQPPHPVDPFLEEWILERKSGDRKDNDLKERFIKRQPGKKTIMWSVPDLFFRHLLSHLFFLSCIRCPSQLVLFCDNQHRPKHKTTTNTLFYISVLVVCV